MEKFYCRAQTSIESLQIKTDIPTGYLFPFAQIRHISFQQGALFGHFIAPIYLIFIFRFVVFQISVIIIGQRRTTASIISSRSIVTIHSKSSSQLHHIDSRNIEPFLFMYIPTCAH